MKEGGAHPLDAKLQTLVSGVLRAGIAASGACLIAGAALMALAPPAAGVDWSLDALVRLPVDRLLPAPQAWLYLGILLLMLTPVARVAVTVLTFAAERDWRYVAISAVVFAVISLSISLAFLL
jgi:uncharacterized membrane protein